MATEIALELRNCINIRTYANAAKIKNRWSGCNELRSAFALNFSFRSFAGCVWVRISQSAVCSKHRTKTVKSKFSSHSRHQKQRETDNGVIHLIVFDQFRSFCTDAEAQHPTATCVRTSSFFIFLSRSFSVRCMGFPMTMMVNMVHSFQWSKEKCRFLFISVLPSFSWMHAKHTHTRSPSVFRVAIDVVAKHFTRLRSRARSRLPSFV